MMFSDRNVKRVGWPHGTPESEPGEPAVSPRLRLPRAASHSNYLTLAAAHTASGRSRDVIRRAVRSGKLGGFIPRRPASYWIRERDVLRLRLQMWLARGASPRLATRATLPDQTESVGGKRSPGRIRNEADR